MSEPRSGEAVMAFKAGSQGWRLPYIFFLTTHEHTVRHDRPALQLNLINSHSKDAEPYRLPTSWGSSALRAANKCPLHASINILNVIVSRSLQCQRSRPYNFARKAAAGMSWYTPDVISATVTSG